MSLTELRPKLEAQIREGQLPEALTALLAKLPDGSETYRLVSALIARLNAANKERFRNTIALEEYQRRIDQVSADFFDLLAALTEADFSAAPSTEKDGKKGKTGTVLYRVPAVMPIQKPTRCTIRVAVDEEAVLENIVLDEHVELKSRVEISDVMSAEIIDLQGNTFQISPLNSRTQLVRDSGFTEWSFNVTPLLVGVHQLLVRVSIMEIVPGYAEPIPREVSLTETVTIVADAEQAEEPKAAAGSGTSEPGAGFKSNGQTFGFQSTFTVSAPYDVSAAPAPQPSSSGNRSLRALGLFLGFLVLIPAVTWAVAPDLPAWVSTHYIEGTPEAYTDFIEKHPESPRLESAFFHRADRSGQLADLRAYQENFQEKGPRWEQVRGKIAALESKSLENIRENPDRANIRQFARDFPESERLTEVKKAVDTRQENRQELLSAVEEAYVAAVKAKPTETKVTAYLRDFPKPEKLNEVDSAARARPEVFQQVQPMLEEAYLKKMEQNPTEAQAEQFLEKFPEPVRKERFERILEKKPALKERTAAKMRKIEQARARGN